MAPKYGERVLTPAEREMREEIINRQFDGEIQETGNGRISTDDAARFAVQMVNEAREAWEEDHPASVQAPDIDLLRAQEATKRTGLRWRYGTIAFVSFLVMVTLAGLTATGHA